MKTPVFKAIPTRQQQHEDTDLEAQQMDYAGVKTSPQQFNPIVDQNLGENQDATKGCTDLHPDKTNIEIDSQHLIPDELLQSINLDYNLSEKIVHHDVRITDEKIDKTNLSDSQFTISDELLPSLNAYRRESITTDPSATREEEPSDEYFNDKKSKSVVQDHCQENKENVESRSKPYMHEEVDLGTEEQIMTTPKIQELTTDEQRKENADHYKRGKSTMPIMHFGVETVEDKNWFYTMGFPDQSWIDSSDFYVKKGIDVENHLRYKDKDSADIFDVLFQENLPQQPSESL
ncbi:hypothetical protein CQW23_22608 [Capsicum baccatum]|uniref:Uncharacterized protein n=1 Tax=Capsicum baccatum TaxID=33114 RepID=A0A2G2W1D2_CAPBA|nr:hypothetical protein CQW23_22608 [Capsicum baccatum]